MLAALLPANGFHQNSSHGLRGGAEEVRATFPKRRRISSEPEPRFVNERGRLESMAGRFPRHFLRGELPQLGIHKRNQLLSSSGVPLRHSVEDIGEVAYGQMLRHRVTVVKC